MSKDVSTAVSQCLSQYLVPVRPGSTLKHVIDLTLDKTRYAGDLAPVVLENPLYSQFVVKVDFLQTRVKEWMTEMPEGQMNVRVLLERIFILLGKQASRNLIAAIRLARLGNQLPRKKSDRFSPNPKEQLKQAITCEEFCEERHYASTELAFLAGLQFDLLQTAFQRAKASREAQGALAIQFPESLKIAHFAYEIGSRMGSFPMSEYAFPAALSMGLGKMLAFALYPKEGGTVSYANFLAEVEKKTTLKWEFFEAEEKKRFPVTPIELASLAVSNYGFFQAIEPAIRFSGEPYYLKTSQPKLFPLALLLNIAATAASGRTLRDHQIAALKALKINPDIVAKATSAILVKDKMKGGS